MSSVMDGCPPAEKLLEFAAGSLSDDSQAFVESHIDGCAACRGALSSLAKNDPMPSKSFGRYELETVIGSGGMGIVYRAWDPQLARQVAIKVVKRLGHDAGDALRKRLVMEAQSLARLSHPNVCHVYDVGTESEEVWVAMELIDGTTLRQWAQTPRSREELLDVLLGAAEGIAAAHAGGLIHRDIKPENVLVTKVGGPTSPGQARPIVMDFGLARIDLPVDPNASTMSGDPVLTATGAIVGTPAYLAPEQLTGDTLDARVDQFAWATMAWELLTGVRPFPIIAAIRLDAIRAGLTPPASFDRKIAGPLTRAMSLAPRDRFDSMRELIDALRAKPKTRSRLPVALAGAAVLAAAATVGVWQLTRDETTVSAATTPITPDAAIPTVVVNVPGDALARTDEPAVDAAIEVNQPEPKIAAKIAPKTAPKTGSGSQAATLADPPPSTPTTGQPPLRPLNNPKFSVMRAYASLVAFCKVPIDVKNPDPKLGKYGIVDWGTITRKERVIATLVDREMYKTLFEVKGQRETYHFDDDFGALGKFDYPVGTMIAVCPDPMRPEKVDIYKLPANWSGGLDQVYAAFPIQGPPITAQLKQLAPLYVTDGNLSVSGSDGKLKVPQASHYLVQAKVVAADGDRWDMDDWFLEVGKAKGAGLVAAGKFLWFVIETPRFEPGPEGEKPKMIAKAVMVFDDIFQR